MDLVRTIAKRSLLFVGIAALTAAFFDWQRLMPGVLIGGALAVLNLRGLARGVQALTSGNATGSVVLIILSQVRLLLLFLIMGFLVYLKVVSIPGLIIGFSIVFVVILIEGWKSTREQKPSPPA